MLYPSDKILSHVPENTKYLYPSKYDPSIPLTGGTRSPLLLPVFLVHRRFKIPNRIRQRLIEKDRKMGSTPQKLLSLTHYIYHYFFYIKNTHVSINEFAFGVKLRYYLFRLEESRKVCCARIIIEYYLYGESIDKNNNLF